MSKTQITPKDLFERRNTTDVFNRLVIMGMLRILNNRLVYDQVWEKDEIQQVTVPFFFDFGGGSISSERFIQDNYTFFSSDECTNLGLKKMDGNFDRLPQGRISLGSVGIQAGNISNRFSMGQYTRIVDGRLKSFTSYLYSIPLEFSFTLEIRCETMLTAYKIDEAVRELFYKNSTFRFNYRGSVCAARAGFPENGLSAQGTQYTTGAAPGENQYIKLNYTIQVETYQPVFDRYNEIPADRYIKEGGVNIHINHRKEEVESGAAYGKERDKQIWLTSKLDGMTLISGQELMLTWAWKYADNDLLQVDIYYKLEGDDTEHMIAFGEDNHDFYYWTLDDRMTTNNKKFDVLFPEQDGMVEIFTEPEIYVWPNAEDHIVDANNVYVKNKGLFNTRSATSQIDALIEYEGPDGSLVQMPATAKLYNYMLDSEHIPLEFECFVYNGDLEQKKMKLYVRDHNAQEVFAESDWFYVV